MSKTLILFGSTSDLAASRLLPGLEKIHEQFDQIIGLGRKTHEEFLSLNKDLSKEFKEKIIYVRGGIYKNDIYEELQKTIEHEDRTYYYSIGPRLFEEVTRKLSSHKLITEQSVVAYEKPFGNSKKNAEEIHTLLSKTFGKENIFFVDHYLGKHAVDNILMFRFANTIIEDLFDAQSIQEIVIYSHETEGVDGRGDYYDSTGALIDVIQNHLLQVLALLCMDAPMGVEPKDIHMEKQKVLEQIELVDDKIVQAQYEGYLDEKNIKEKSTTETYIKLEVNVNSERWRGVPIILETGKKMHQKKAGAKITFKKKHCSAFCDHWDLPEQILEIEIQPKQDITLTFHTKKPQEFDPITKKLYFSYDQEFVKKTSKAYTTIFSSLINKNHRVFASYKEIQAQWVFIEKIVKVLQHHTLKKYEKGSKGLDFKEKK